MSLEEKKNAECLHHEIPQSIERCICFSASAGTYVYQMGIAAYLQEHFDLTNVKFSGSSGGSWSAVLLASNSCIQNAFNTMNVIADDLYKDSWIGGYFRYDQSIFKTCEEIWKNDTELYKKVEDKLGIAVTKFPTMEKIIHTSWDSNLDLTHSIVASGLIPFLLNGRPCIKHRGEYFMDGGFTNFKGIHHDHDPYYSTWSDVLFHTKDYLATSLSQAASYIDPFFPALTKKVVNTTYNWFNPHDEECHTEIFTSNHVLHQKLIITPWIWKTPHVSDFHLTVCSNRNHQSFQEGYKDAFANHHELAVVCSQRIK